MIEASVGLADHDEVETTVRGNATGMLQIHSAAGSIQLWSMDPSVWARLAAACTALHATHMAALTPPRREMIP